MGPPPPGSMLRLLAGAVPPSGGSEPAPKGMLTRLSKGLGALGCSKGLGKPGGTPS